MNPLSSLGPDPWNVDLIKGCWHRQLRSCWWKSWVSAEDAESSGWGANGSVRLCWAHCARVWANSTGRRLESWKILAWKGPTQVMDMHTGDGYVNSAHFISNPMSIPENIWQARGLGFSMVIVCHGISAVFCLSFKISLIVCFVWFKSNSTLVPKMNPLSAGILIPNSPHFACSWLPLCGVLEFSVHSHLWRVSQFVLAIMCLFSLPSSRCWAIREHGRATYLSKWKEVRNKCCGNVVLPDKMNSGVHKWGRRAPAAHLSWPGNVQNTSLTEGNNYSHTPGLQFRVQWRKMSGCQIVQNV